MNKSNSVSNLVFEKLPTEILSTIVVYADFPPLNRVCKYFSEQSETILFAPLFYSYKNYQTSYLLRRKVKHIEQTYLQASNTEKVKAVYLAIIAGIDKKYVKEVKQSTLGDCGVLSPKRLDALLELIVNRRLNKKKMEIFDRLFIPCKESTYTSWEEQSFKNDIKMKTGEVLMLIEALGGRYSRKGGDKPGPIYFLAYLPKIGPNGEKVEEEDKMIALTRDRELKVYQIKELRETLIKQGFTPDTVGPLVTL